MAKLTFRSHYAPGAKDDTWYEVQLDKISETVQGEASTIAQLLKREMQGMVQTRKQVAYLDEEDLDKINRFYRPLTDLTDLDDFREYVNDLKLKIDHFEAERKEKERLRQEELKAPKPKPEIEAKPKDNEDGN